MPVCIRSIEISISLLHYNVVHYLSEVVLPWRAKSLLRANFFGQTVQGKAFVEGSPHEGRPGPRLGKLGAEVIDDRVRFGVFPSCKCGISGLIGCAWANSCVVGADLIRKTGVE